MNVKDLISLLSELPEGAEINYHRYNRNIDEIEVDNTICLEEVMIDKYGWVTSDIDLSKETVYIFSNKCY